MSFTQNAGYELSELRIFTPKRSKSQGTELRKWSAAPA
jgi:hypothetical protein